MGLTISPCEEKHVQDANKQPRIGRKKRQRRRQRTKDNEIKLATWNLRSLYRVGALQNTLYDLEKYEIDVAAVQETRWLDSGIHAMKAYTFYYSGNKQMQHEFGTGFMVKKAFDHCIIGFKPVSKYISTLRFQTKTDKVTLINAHAPTEAKEDHIKDSFYDELDRIYDSIPTSDIKMVIGDMNAQVGKEEAFRTVVGVHSLHAKSNDNGCRLVQFAAAKNMVTRSTHFDRKDIHKITWISNDGRTKTQIDHVLIEKHRADSITNVRSYRGTTHESDHHLIKSIMRLKKRQTTKKKAEPRPKYNTGMLKNEAVQKRFIDKVEEKLAQEEEPNESTLDEAVNKTMGVLAAAAEEVLGIRRGTRKNNWFDEECREAAIRKKEALNKMQQRKTRSTEANYKKLRDNAYRLMRRKKRQHLNKEITEIEEKNRNGNIRQFYEDVNKKKKTFRPQAIKIKDANGDLVSDEYAVAQRWKDYFESLLNRPTNQLETERRFSTAEPHIETPTLEEVAQAIKNLKNYKAAGEDNIPAELIKNGGKTLCGRLHQIIVRVWEEQEMPTAWNTGLIIPIHKKGDKTDCTNYRGICLLNTSYKVMAKILYNRLVGYTEEIIGDYQCGFRRARSTTDQIFAIRQIMEKAYEYNVNIQQLFVDFQQAYDSVDRLVLYNIMSEFGIPYKLVQITKATMNGSKGKVLIQHTISEPFDIKTGLRQGDCLSTLLFNLALEKVARALSVNWKGTILNTSKQICAFADDVDLLGRSVLAVKESFVEMEEEASNIGLKISENKTKYLALDRRNGVRLGQNLTIGDYNIETVQSFKYLGSILNTTNEIEEEIKMRTLQGNRCFFALKQLFRSPILSRSTKLRVYKTILRPVVMYGSETWTTTIKQENQLNAFERKLLRSIIGPVRDENGIWRIRTNRELTDIFGPETLTAAIKAGRIRWAGHVMRMDHTRTVKKILTRNIAEGVRVRGRPRKRWLDCVEEDLIKLGVANWKDMAQDRTEWRAVVERAKTQLGS